MIAAVVLPGLLVACGAARRPVALGPPGGVLAEPAGGARPPTTWVENDVAVEARLRGRLAVDPFVGGQPVDVDVDSGVARPSGDVKDRRLAVDARLTWLPGAP